jgi:hypothetical protein
VTLTLLVSPQLGCPNSVISSKTLTLVPAPVADAGSTLSACGANPISLSGATASNHASVQWNTSGSGSFTPNNTTLNAVYNPSAADVSAGSVTLTLTALGNSPCGNAISSVTLDLNVCNITWTGATSIDWHTASNWSPAIVPNACGASVVIPHVTNQPHIFGNIDVGDIRLLDDVELTIQAGLLNVCGHWTGGNTTNAKLFAPNGCGTGVRFGGTSLQSITGKSWIESATISNAAGVTVDLGGVVEIAECIELGTGTVNTTGTLVLLSTSSRTAFIDDFSPGMNGDINGDIVAQRYIGSGTGNDQHYLTSPVNQPSFNELADDMPGGISGGWTAQNNVFVTPKPTCDPDMLANGSNYGNVFQWVEAGPNGNGTFTYGCLQSGWRVKSAGNMGQGLGYSAYVMNGSTVDVTGAPNTGDVTVGGLTNSGYATGNVGTFVVESGWNMIGNPYPSSVDLTVAQSASIDPSINIWHTAGQYHGTYQPVLIGVNAQLAPFQAFMVRNTVSNSTTNFTFHHSSERTRTQQPYYRQFSGSTLQLDVTGNSFADVTYVNFNSTSSSNYDLGIDAEKVLSNYFQPTLYTLMDASSVRRLAINSYKDIATTSSVPLGLLPGADGQFSFTASGLSSFDPTSYVYLEDLATAAPWHNLRQNPTYSFSQTKTEDPNRFVLHFTPAAIVSSTAATCAGDGNISIQQPGIANWSYAITNSQSTIVSSGTLNATSPVNVNGLSAGTYTLTLQDNAGYTVVKSITVGGASAVSAAFSSSTTNAQTYQDINFNCTTPNAVDYEWEFSDGTIITGVANPIYAFLEPGTYTVTLTVTNVDGCTSTVSQTINVTQSATGIQNILSDKVQIFSFRNSVFVDFSKLKHVEATVQVYNLIGQELSNEKCTTTSIYKKAFDNLEAAYVLVKVKTTDGIITKKVFITNSNK